MPSDRYLDPKSGWPQLVKELCKKTPPYTLTSWPLLFRPTSQHMVLSQRRVGVIRGFGSRHPANRRPGRSNGVRGRRNTRLRAISRLRARPQARHAAQDVSKMANAPRRPDRQGDGLYRQKRISEEVKPARLRAGRQRVGRVGCFQIHGTRGWRGMDVFVQRRECFGRMSLMGELQCMYDENLKRLLGIGRSSHLSDPATSCW